MSDFIIKNGALEGYRGNSTEIIIPEGVHTIDMLAFSREKKAEIKSIQLPQSLEIIENWVFDHCKKLERIIIPASVREIGRGAFYSCSSLKEVIIEGSPQMGESAFSWTPWEDAEFKRVGAQINGTTLLKVHPDLTEYTIPSSIKIIGKNAFQRSNIRKLTIPEGVEEIEFYAFESSLLEEVTLPKSLKFIRGGAFSNCSNLKSLTIHKGIRHINSDAFVNLTSCSLTILSGAEENGIDHFESTTSVKEVHAPYGSSAMRAALISGIPFYPLPGNPRKYNYVNNEFCCIGSTLYQYLGHQETVNVPDGIEMVGKDAFNCSLNCRQIKHVHLPPSTKYVDENAFVGCKQLETIDGDGVQQIEYHAFAGCEQLRKVVFPNLRKYYDMSFVRCNALSPENMLFPRRAIAIKTRVITCGHIDPPEGKIHAGATRIIQK